LNCQILFESKIIYQIQIFILKILFEIQILFEKPPDQILDGTQAFFEKLKKSIFYILVRNWH